MTTTPDTQPAPSADREAAHTAAVAKLRAIYSGQIPDRVAREIADAVLDAIRPKPEAETTLLRERVAADIHRARLPVFAAGEDPALVARTVRAVDVRLAQLGPYAPYYVPAQADDATAPPASAPCGDCGTTNRPCGHCPRCDRCEDCGECSGGGCTCACEGSPQ